MWDTCRTMCTVKGRRSTIVTKICTEAELIATCDSAIQALNMGHFITAQGYGIHLPGQPVWHFAHGKGKKGK